MRAFEIGKTMARADAILALPPALPRIVRPKPQGRRIARFVLPLDACKTGNRKRHGMGWMHARDTQRVAVIMRAQAAPQRAPLPGRPMVLCTRFSCTEPDPYSDWAKATVDALTLPTGRAPNRLGYIVDDKPRYATVVQWWEPGPRGDGIVLIQVYEGDPGADILEGRKPRKRRGGGEQEGRRA